MCPCGSNKVLRRRRNWFEKIFGIKEKWQCQDCGRIHKV